MPNLVEIVIQKVMFKNIWLTYGVYPVYYRTIIRSSRRRVGYCINACSRFTSRNVENGRYHTVLLISRCEGKREVLGLPWCPAHSTFWSQLCCRWKVHLLAG